MCLCVLVHLLLRAADTLSYVINARCIEPHTPLWLFVFQTLLPRAADTLSYLINDESVPVVRRCGLPCTATPSIRYIRAIPFLLQNLAYTRVALYTRDLLALRSL